jgi:hypothetical protein
MHLCHAQPARPGNLSRLLLLALLVITASGCLPLRPKAITADRYYLSEQLHDGQPQIQRGKPRKILDAAGWVIGIPGKILLWNRRVDNHRISPETEAALAEYMAVNGLETTRVRLNQYAPMDDWRRLVRNKRVGAGWRYTFGALSTLGETLLPGRLLGGDHYNPFTDTIHLYSDIPAIAYHEGGHAKDFARRKWKGTYAVVYGIPGVSLYHESLATADTLAYVNSMRPPAEQREALNVLYPAYGTYVGSSLGYALPGYSTPLYYGSIVAGHAWGRTLSSRIADEQPVSKLGAYPIHSAATAVIQPGIPQPAAMQTGTMQTGAMQPGVSSLPTDSTPSYALPSADTSVPPAFYFDPTAY